ncbi:ABC transporter ATP-binding protein [Wenzhouxiangella marina]|uniref:Multidrug ABC transporter ATP-binding protein n=1 Tax=Wenzhouxiangella marina TaxID=1579979 RepID=A0A0K0XXI3_9GAMM|nr:ABC transporter ATP-binding protein [Wenzhouxiangella marina]AKS42321.1 multidrug ABC transporter ATP-binding protein [Wenzhouxiangella marina]MBB6085906.1 ABC-2 type transport system ATP-binding protein [Wenzhouxiangella marina]
MTSTIRARNLSRSFGKTRALDGIDLDIPSGRIVGLIGPNGAGKTTALKAILGLGRYDGELEVLGLDPSHSRDRLMQDVCFIADVAVLPRWARVKHIIQLTEDLHPRFSRERCMYYLNNTKIKMDAKVKALSKGMVVQLHLALVMAIDAKLLVLDEPTLGLDILFRKRFYSNLLNEYFDEERTIVITTHQVEEVEHILTDLIFIKDGKLVLNSTMDDIHERYTEVMVKADRVDEARQLGPLHERVLFGRHILLFDRADSVRLRELGEIHKPSVADLFVALMGDEEGAWGQEDAA